MLAVNRLPRVVVLVCLTLLAASSWQHAVGQTMTAGRGEQDVQVAGVSLTIFTYRPASCEPRLALLVFHGESRSARAYRNYARTLADAACAVIAAPLFPEKSFPQRAYQYGGAATRGGLRTIDLVPGILAWLRAAAGHPDLPYVLIGHSAGGQFIDRVAAYGQVDARRIVVANPSTWVLPSLDVAAPFGFGGTIDAEASLKTYLARPVVVLLGTADLTSKELAMSPQAMAQGQDRYHRGLRTFQMARDEAARHGWPFGWTLAEVPNVGHSAKAMFASPQALQAVAGDDVGRMPR